MRIAVDTDVLVRYLTWDDEHQAQTAADLIEAAVHVSTGVLCEVVWVLTRAYRYQRNEVVPTLERLIAGRELRSIRLPRGPGSAYSKQAVILPTGLFWTICKVRRVRTFDRDLARLIEPTKVVLLGS